MKDVNPEGMRLGTETVGTETHLNEHKMTKEKIREWRTAQKWKQQTT